MNETEGQSLSKEYIIKLMIFIGFTVILSVLT